jgi:hypothetical protein
MRLEVSVKERQNSEFIKKNSYMLREKTLVKVGH